MSADQRIQHYLCTAIKEGLYSTEGKLRFHLKTLFGNVDFENKRVLDIGGGKGLHSFYAASRGAKEVVCLEPEAAGSRLCEGEKFRKLEEIFDFNNVTLEQTTLQAYESKGETFDVIILHNSINHLSEGACIDLLNDAKAVSIYKNIFSKINSLSNRGAKLIICDCSRHNFFAVLRIKNPFAGTIEWHKHQAPVVWAKLLSEEGFSNHRIKWTTLNRLRYLGRILFSSKLCSFFFTSHFCLTMEKQ